MHVNLVGVSLSEPHINEMAVCKLLLLRYVRTYVSRAPLYALYAVRDIFRRPHEETSALSSTTCFYL